MSKVSKVARSDLPKKSALSAAVAAAVVSMAASAQEAGVKRELEEVMVTATRIEGSKQDVPVTVSSLGSDEIEELGITNFAEYSIQLPSVTAGGSGPGQNTIYIRGVASTTPNLSTAGVAGLAPNVAFYLDDQPLSQPGRNLDVYAADLARIEVLSGPQGTLFGASSQAGNVRLITNKPDTTETYGSVQFGASTVEEGGSGGNLQAMMNLPVSDQVAIRGVFYYDKKPGWIDNVHGQVDASEAGRFRPEGTMRNNGVPVSAGRAGFQSTADLSNVNFIKADNSDLVDNNVNDTTYLGGRLSVQWDINEDWDVLISHTRQETDADGLFFADPDLGDLDVQRFAPDQIKDKFHNTAWTLTGMFGELEAIYTGAFTKRDSDQIIDYTDYLFVGQYLPYYICDGSVTYPGAAGPAGTCQAPVLFNDSGTELEVQTHELRFTTDQALRWRMQGGVFYSDLELHELNDFTYINSVHAIGFNGQAGWAPNYPLTNTSVTGEVGNAKPGWYSDPGPFPPGVIFRNDVLRTDEQFGVFGEMGYDLSDQFSVTFGARYYDIEVDFEGSANSSFYNFGQTADAQAFGTNISAQFAPGNDVGAPDVAKADGFIFKATVDWRPVDGQLYYFTWSEGFRPGLLNRPGGRTNAAGNFTVPFVLDTDDVTNFELGVKADLLDSTFRVNAAAFHIQIEQLQTTIFDPSIVNLFFSDNAADAEVTGFEADFTWLPEWSYGLTIGGAVSILDTKLTKVITPTNDVRKGDELAFAPSFQGNLRARYEWEIGSMGWTAHVMPMVVWTTKSYSDIIVINRDRVDGWMMGNITAGVADDKWSVELYVNNVTDERAEVSRSFVYDRDRVTYAQPRTIGLRAGIKF